MKLREKIAEIRKKYAERHASKAVSKVVVEAKGPNTQQSQKTPVAEKPKVETPKVYGNRGRLEIPELRISVPLYDTGVGPAQVLVDRQNSAAFLRWNSQNAIVDHSDQCNFENLNKVRVGGTTMTIETPSSKKRYFCVKSQVGHIKIGATGGNQIFDQNWESPYFKNSGGICIYTCMTRSAPDVMDIRLTYWQPA